MRGFHPESQCTKKTINDFSKLLEHNNIFLPQSARKSEEGQETEEHERFHALKESFSWSKAYLIDSGESNHMVASKGSFTTLDLSGGPNIHMGDNSQIPIASRRSIKIQHGEFKYVLYVPSLAANLLSVYQMTHTGSPKEVIFGPESVEISDISTRNIIVKVFSNHACMVYEFSHFL